MRYDYLQPNNLRQIIFSDYDNDTGRLRCFGLSSGSFSISVAIVAVSPFFSALSSSFRVLLAYMVNATVVMMAIIKDIMLYMISTSVR